MLGQRHRQFKPELGWWAYIVLRTTSRVVVSTAAFHARVRDSVPGLGGLKATKNVSSSSTCESQYCGEPPWPRGSVLDLRPPGLEFRILCVEDCVISIISPSSGGSPGPVYPICAQRWPKARSISFHLLHLETHGSTIHSVKLNSLDFHFCHPVS